MSPSLKILAWLYLGHTQSIGMVSLEPPLLKYVEITTTYMVMNVTAEAIVSLDNEKEALFIGIVKGISTLNAGVYCFAKSNVFF